MSRDLSEFGEAFADFVRAHGRSLFGTAYLLTGDGTAAEELVQDTLAALFPKWHLVSAAKSPIAYARRALTNRFLDARRRPAADAVGLWRVPDSPVDDMTERVADQQVIWQLVGRLPARQRAAIVLRYFHDQSDEQIGVSLGCRPSTVRSLISRGLATMRSAAVQATPPPVVRNGDSP